MLAPSNFLSLQSDLPELLISPLLVSPLHCRNMILNHSHSFCQGALSGFHQATHILLIDGLTICSHHSSPLLHRPRASRTTCFLLGSCPPQDFSAFFHIFGFFFTKIFKITSKVAKLHQW